MTKRTYKDIRRVKYWNQKDNARKRGVTWEMTFEEWWEVWESSGVWEQRGCKRGQYCMSRKGDIGPYSKDNVFIQLHGSNLRDAHLGKPKGPNSLEHNQNISRAKKRAPKSPLVV